MASKQHSAAATEEAQQVFRQFAWNLAGTLAGSKAGTAAKPRPAKGAGKR